MLSKNRILLLQGQELAHITAVLLYLNLVFGFTTLNLLEGQRGRRSLTLSGKCPLQILIVDLYEALLA